MNNLDIIDDNFNENSEFENPESTSFTPIYSKRAIWGFAFFCFPLFAAIMLRQNLIDVANASSDLSEQEELKRQSIIMLLICLVYSLICYYFFASIQLNNSVITYIVNFIGAGILDYFFRKNIPNAENHPKKKILKPLIIAIAIVGFALITVLSFAD